MQQNDKLFEGLIVDNFAGGGGASCGIELATGRKVDIALNHDEAACVIYKANNPDTIVKKEDVFKVDIKAIVGGRPVLLCWFSPDCKHFSKAKGGKPVDKHIRGLAWVAVKWAKIAKPRIIMLENVEEFQTWGPIGEDGKPIKEKAGSTFRKFVKELENCGYIVEFRVLVAADYGAPTKRKRFFLIARNDGLPIVWPKKEFAPAGKCKPGQKVWKSAASIIDFSLPVKSIFNRKKDLAEPTKRRIGRGLEKFVLRSASPFIIPIGYGEKKGQAPRVNDIKQPVTTVVSSTKQNLVVPYLQDALFMKNETRRLLDLKDPHPTIAAGGQHTELCEAKIAPYMAVNNFTDYGRKITAPVATVTGVNKEAVIQPKLLPFMAMIGENGFQAFRDLSIFGPTKTIVTKAEHLLVDAMVSPFISQNYGGNYTGKGSDVSAPVPTIRQADHNRMIFTLMAPFVGVNNFSNVGSSCGSPSPTITTAHDKNVLIAPVITDYKFENDGQKVSDPLGTETAVRSHYVTASMLTEYYGHSDASSLADPLGAVVSHDRFSKVDVSMKDSAFIQEYYGGFYKGDGAKIENPLPTATTKPRFWLVKVHFEKADLSKLGNWPLVRIFINSYTTVKIAEDQILLIRIDGRDYFISDIGMRMLTPRELYDAQGFPHDYIIDRDCYGKSYPASQQVARCGNAVPPPFAEALVRANLPEICKDKIATMETLRKIQKVRLADQPPMNGVSGDGQTSIFTDFDLLSKQLKEERKGMI